MKTMMGKEITVTTAFRLPLIDYQRACTIAIDEGVKLSVVMRRLVAAGLAVREEETNESS